MRLFTRSASTSVSVICETLEARRLLSVSATGLSPAGVAGSAKSYDLASFTTTDSPLKARNYAATVNFGDGSSGKGRIKFAQGIFSVVATHRYIDPGTISAEVTITDKVDTTSQTVTASVDVVPSHTKAGLTVFTGSRAPYFQTAFGGAWRAVGNNYRNKTITATRILDTKDIIFSGNIVSAAALGAYSLSSQQFGYIPDTSAGSYVNLFNVTGSGANANGGVGPTTMPATYQLARSGGFEPTLSSDPANNPDGRDHMLTYQLKGLPGESANEVTYVVFWEDTPGLHSDFDFNDLIVELTLQKS
jgi:hypothetical protein